MLFGCIILIISLLYSILWAYDTYSKTPDGLINGYDYQNIIRLLGILTLIGFLAYLGLTSRQKLIQNISLSFNTTIICLLLLEGVAQTLVRLGKFDPISLEFRRYHIDPTLNYRPSLFWGDFNEHTGRWRMPNATHTLTSCLGDSLLRFTNSVGASDRERTVQKSDPRQKRVITLGDSFMEGTMVNYEDRVSNQLEVATGCEHLNFAINGTSPINYYLTYKNIAKPFAHDVVLVGLLPANDFQDYTPAQAYTLVEWPIYRPYWQGQYPTYTLRYSLHNIDQSISRNNRQPGKIRQTIDSVYKQLSITDQVKADILLNSALYKVVQKLAGQLALTDGRMTSYELFSDTDFMSMRYSLENLVQEATGKQLVLLSIPTQNDVLAIKNGHKNRLDGQLQQFCTQQGILFIPLLPPFLAYAGNVADLYTSCDGHWSKKGEQFVSDFLLKNPRYRTAIGQLPRQ